MFSVGASCKCPASSHRRMSLSSAWLGSSSSRQFRFPDSGTLGGKHIKDYALKERAEYFGVDLKTDISVDTETVGPCSKITGHLVIDTKFPIEHDGIFVQLEALCSLNYTTKFNERTSVHKGKGCILENKIRCEIIPVTAPEFGGHSINSGVWDYPFQLQIPCDQRLPTPFKNSSYGNLEYRLIVYMISHSASTYIKLTEKNMTCEGFFNLFDDEESAKPIIIEQYRKSYFQKKQVKATLSVDRTGFLRQEEIPFTLFLKNPKCTPLHLSVSLVNHVKYQASNLASLVKLVTTVDSQEKDECDEPKPEVEWIGSINIPESQVPTYACNSMYSVNYVLEVKSLEEEVILSGQARILLGTTRDPLKQEHCSSEDCAAAAAAAPQPGDLYRSGSESSIHSQRSIYSAPIAYSVPANLNLSIDEPGEDELHENDESDQRQQEPATSSHLLSAHSPSPRHQRSHSQHDISETLQEQEEDNEIEPFLSAPYMTTSEHSLLSAQTAMSLPPSYSQLSYSSTETLPPTYADLDLNVDPPASLIIGDAVDLEKRYSINLDTLNLEDEYQVTFYSV